MKNRKEKVIKKTEQLSDYVTNQADLLSVEKDELIRDSRQFRIWYIENQIQNQPNLNDFTTTHGKLTDDNIGRYSEWNNQQLEKIIKAKKQQLSDKDKLTRIKEQRIKECQQDIVQNDKLEKRPFLISELNTNDLDGEITVSYDIQESNNPPELIIVRADKEIYEQPIESGFIANTRKKIHKAIEKNNLEDKESLLQPIIAVVANKELLETIDEAEMSRTNKLAIKKERIKEIFIKQGANLVIENFEINDIEALAQLVAKIKNDPASLAPEKVREEKVDFYNKVEGIKMGNRAEITADTEKELEILTEIFKKNNVKNILDIGCGVGRIDIPLASDESLVILGLDVNDEILEDANKHIENLRNIKFIKGDLIDYTNHPDIEDGSQDAVIYTWHSFLEAFGPGNTLKTLNSAWLALKKGGVLVFDMPTRENMDMADGWYYNKIDEDTEYLSYIINEDEIRLMLKLTGFKDVEIKSWETKSSELYPQGMKKITISAIKN